MWHYRLYGLSLRSTAPIPGLLPLPSAAPSDCTVRFETEPLPEPGADVVLHEGEVDPESQTAVVTVRRTAEPPHVWTIEYADGTRFAIAGGGADVWCARRDSLSPEDTATYLLGPVLAYVLRLRGTLALHASAVEVGGGALLIAGHPGAGKSTTAAAFARRGGRVITDDVAALEPRGGAVFVHPGYPRLRLWDDSAQALIGDLPRLTPNWEKRYLDVDLADSARPVAAIAVLIGRRQEAAVERVRGHRAAIALLRHASMTHALDDAMRDRELAQVTELAEAVPVFEVAGPDSFERLDTLREALAGIVTE